MTIHRCEARQSLSTYVGQRQMGHERGILALRAFLHTIWLSRVDLYTSSFDSSGHLYGYSNATMMIHRCEARQSSSPYVCQTQMKHERGILALRAFLHTIWLSRVDLSTSSKEFESRRYRSSFCGSRGDWALEPVLLSKGSIPAPDPFGKLRCFRVGLGIFI